MAVEGASGPQTGSNLPHFAPATQIGASWAPHRLCPSYRRATTDPRVIPSRTTCGVPNNVALSYNSHPPSHTPVITAPLYRPGHRSVRLTPPLTFTAQHPINLQVQRTHSTRHRCAPATFHTYLIPSLHNTHTSSISHSQLQIFTGYM